jgi:hypothetical protein
LLCRRLIPSHQYSFRPGRVGPVEASLEPQAGLAVLAGGAVLGVVEQGRMRSNLDQRPAAGNVRVELPEALLAVTRYQISSTPLVRLRQTACM